MNPQQVHIKISDFYQNMLLAKEGYKIIKDQLIYIYTGEKQYSGTGKNARQTNIVTEFDMYSFLPIKISATHVYGERTEICVKQPYADFFKKAKECYHYAAYFTASQPSVLLNIQGSNKALSAVFEYENGKIYNGLRKLDTNMASR